MDTIDTKERRFSPAELQRYARHFSLAEIGLEGQRRLHDARILLVGAGGLGSPAALYLAAAGVGTLGIVDPDRVDLSNLQRQILHGTADVGRPKVESATERLRDVNPHVRVEAHEVRLTSTNALDLVERYDLVVDGSDNFPTRYLVNDACVLTGRPWVYGAVLRWEGQLALFAAPGEACYRCLFSEPPPPGMVPGCAEAGVMGVLPGIIGGLQALEAMKWILARDPQGDGGRNRGMEGRLLIFDALDLSFREVSIARDPRCPVCGDEPSIRELVDYEHFCATGQVRPASAAEEEGDGAPPEDEVTPREDEVTPLELAERLRANDDDFLLLDVREPWEWEVSNLAAWGARNVPLDELPGELEGLVEAARDAEEVVVYCRTGARSERAARMLREAGAPRARNLVGGLRAWARDVDPDLPVA